MTKDEALRLALEALENITSVSICEATHHAKKDRHLLCEECPNEVRHLKAITAIKAALEAKDEPVAIKWEKDADKECHYNNWVGITPFGKILITWKGWKEYHDACVDEFPGGFEAYGLPDDVKAACEVEYLRRLYTTPPQRKPLTDEMHKAGARYTIFREQASFFRGWLEAEAAHGIKGDA